MSVRPEFAHLVPGSKCGVGTQGEADVDRILTVADAILALDENATFYASRLHERCWVRIMNDPHGGWLADPVGHARAIAPLIARLRADYGVRDFLFINEPIGLEGLGDSEDDYRRLDWWLCACMPMLRAGLSARGAVDCRLWGPALSPGHNEDDNFYGYRLLVNSLQLWDGIAVHNYWYPGGGFIGQPDAEWWSQRILRAHALVEGELRIVKPWAIAEFNRKINRGDPADIVAYAWECQRYYQWLNSLSWVVAAFTFLYCRRDPAFMDLSWADMPGMVELMQGFDRQSDGEFAQGASTVDKAKIGLYAAWAVARLIHDEDPRDVSAFIAHLKALAADWQHPIECGLPYVEVVPKA